MPRRVRALVGPGRWHAAGARGGAPRLVKALGPGTPVAAGTSSARSHHASRGRYCARKSLRQPRGGREEAWGMGGARGFKCRRYFWVATCVSRVPCPLSQPLTGPSKQRAMLAVNPASLGVGLRA